MIVRRRRVIKVGTRDPTELNEWAANKRRPITNHSPRDYSPHKNRRSKKKQQQMQCFWSSLTTGPVGARKIALVITASDGRF